jgi:hypothetical protein
MDFVCARPPILQPVSTSSNNIRSVIAVIRVGPRRALPRPTHLEATNADAALKNERRWSGRVLPRARPASGGPPRRLSTITPGHSLSRIGPHVIPLNPDGIRCAGPRVASHPADARTSTRWLCGLSDA